MSDLAPVSPPPITVLMVDDEPLTARSAQRLLSLDRDIRFHACADPALAEALAEELRPTVILQDLVMPMVDGLAMVRAFRANPATRDVPIIVLSSEEGPSVKADAFAAGADDYLVKFPDRIEMLARIHHHARARFRRQEQHEELEALADSQRRLTEESRHLRRAFGRYLSDPVAERLLESPEGFELGGDVREVTIMMTDLRGFTSLAERLPPARMVRLINNYLDVMTGIIVRHQGTIDEFIGDAILAIFGAPERRPDDAERAVACAVEMQLAMSEVNAKNHAEGLPDVEMGIGLNTGEVMVGNIGSTRRTKYGVVGAAVNLTARIESYTTGGQLLISGATLDAAGPSVVVVARMRVSPKGVAQPVDLYRIGGVRGRYDLHLGNPTLPLEAPRTELGVRFTVLEGKDAGGAPREGRIARLSEHGAEIASTNGAPALANLKLELTSPDGAVVAGEVYAKVTDGGTGAFTVRFTSVPAEAAAWLASTRR